MENDILGRLFSGEDNLNPRIYEGRISHRYSIVDGDGNVFSDNLAHDVALRTRETLRAQFGGTFNIIETQTLDRDGKEIFSGEKTEIFSHVSSHDRPMISSHVLPENVQQTFPWDVLHDVPDAILDDRPHHRPSKVAPTNSKVVERTFSGASSMPVEILMDRGYSLFDRKAGKFIFSATKSVMEEYIKNRSSKDIPKSDRLDIRNIKIVRYSSRETFLAELAEKGYRVVHVGQGIVTTGTKEEISQIIVKYIKANKISDPKKVIRIEKIVR